MGKSSKAQTTTQTNAAPAYLQPYLTQAASAAQSAYQDPNNTTIYEGNRVADYGADTTNALNLIRQRAIGGSPLEQQAISETQKMASGDYLNNNPYIDQMIGNINDETLRKYATVAKPSAESAAARGGNFGSSAYFNAMREGSQNVTRDLASNATNIRGQNYATERQNQINAVNQLPQLAQIDYNNAAKLGQVGTAYDDLEKQKLQAEISKFYEQRGVNQDALNNYISQISQIGQGQGTQSTTTPAQKTNWLTTGLGLAAAGAGVATGNPMMGFAAMNAINGQGGGQSYIPPMQSSGNPFATQAINLSPYTYGQNQGTTLNNLPWLRD